MLAAHGFEVGSLKLAVDDAASIALDSFLIVLEIMCHIYA